MKIQAASECHFEQVAKLVTTAEELYTISPSATFPWDVAQIRQVAKVRSNLTVCIIDDAVVGFGNLYNVRPSHSAFIGNIIVSGEHAGKGVGSALVKYLSSLCINDYQATPKLSVFNFNTRAILLYNKLGFVPYQIESRCKPCGEPVALMHMSLQTT
ncbi:GNAT family N-acetyltransferase [Vibrio sp. WXL103]|uniref:GNAT family N-acetyltransferase n=1 Tax=Vibrio sp. WXL103 TaxID=3450710 RepID=UPI003EC67841